MDAERQKSPDDPEWQAAHVAACQAAGDLIRAQRRSLTLPEATEIVVAEGRRRNVRIPTKLAEDFARFVLDPYWALKHPIKAYRDGLRLSWR